MATTDLQSDADAGDVDIEALRVSVRELWRILNEPLVDPKYWPKPQR